MNSRRAFQCRASDARASARCVSSWSSTPRPQMMVRAASARSIAFSLALGLTRCLPRSEKPPARPELQMPSRGERHLDYRTRWGRARGWHASDDAVAPQHAIPDGGEVRALLACCVAHVEKRSTGIVHARSNRPAVGACP
jgi:hypothetical protein